MSSDLSDAEAREHMSQLALVKARALLLAIKADPRLVRNFDRNRLMALMAKTLAGTGQPYLVITLAVEHPELIRVAAEAGRSPSHDPAALDELETWMREEIARHTAAIITDAPITNAKESATP